jgi:hypothetical protein
LERKTVKIGSGIMNKYKPLIGVQGTVMGWDDPWHYKLCGSKMRTGEGRMFPSQDSRPSPEEFINLIKSMGVDFYMHSVMPDNEEINNFIESITDYNIPYMLNNEFGIINGPYAEGTNRYDVPSELAGKAKQTGRFLGLIYDETEHLQLHPNMYTRINNALGDCTEDRHQWTDTKGKTLQQIEDDLVSAVSQKLKEFGPEIDVYSEQVFSLMYHALSRGGINPCPKTMKEEFQSLQLSSALGAAKQYGRKLGVCVDLWGFDVGEWFTRIWGFPGHSPREFESALRMSYLMSPDMMFLENVDVLACHKMDGFWKTEFSEIFEAFTKKFVKENPLPYHHSMACADIAFIRSDDADLSIYGTFEQGGLYGSKSLKGDYKTQSVFKVFNLLSRGRITPNGISFHNTGFTFPCNDFVRDEHTLKSLPLIKGVGKQRESCAHKLFYPMNNVLVFDEHVTARALGKPKLIIAAGSRMTDACFTLLLEKAKEGSLCIIAKWLLPEDFRADFVSQINNIVITEDFLSQEIKELVEPYLGESECWSQRFGEYEVKFYNPSNDGITLEHEIVKLR